MKLSEIRKAVVAGIGSVVTLVVAAQDSFGLYLSPEVANGAATVVALVTAVATYLTRNDVVDVVDRY
jgi:hypothetical protein